MSWTSVSETALTVKGPRNGKGEEEKPAWCESYYTESAEAGNNRNHREDWSKRCCRRREHVGSLQLYPGPCLLEQLFTTH